MRKFLVLGAIIAATVMFTGTNTAEAHGRRGYYRGGYGYGYGYGGYRGYGYNTGRYYRGYYPRTRGYYRPNSFYYSSPRFSVGIGYGGYGGYGCYGY